MSFYVPNFPWRYIEEPSLAAIAEHGVDIMSLVFVVVGMMATFFLGVALGESFGETTGRVRAMSEYQERRAALYR